MQEREIQVPTSYIQDAPSKFFLALRVAQIKEAKGFFSDKLHTRTRTWKPFSSARAGLSSKIRGTKRRPRKVVCLRKKGTSERRNQDDQGSGLSPQEGDLRRFKKRKRPEGKKVAPRRKISVCPQPRNFFFWFTSTWVLRDPSRVNIGSYET